MLFLSRQKRVGWLSVCFSTGQIDIVHAVRAVGGIPRILRLESYARSADDAGALALLAKQKKLSSYRCTTLLGHGAYQVLQIDAPEVSVDEMRDAVRWRLKDMLDFPADAAMVDVLELPVAPSTGRPRSILAVAASNTELAPRMLAFDKAGLDLRVIDIPEMAQRNIAALCEDENRGLAFLTLAGNGGLLTFTYKGELCLARRIEVGSQQLVAADDDRRSQLHERIGLELQRSLDNFERMYTMISVSKVVVGPCPSAPGLIEHLRDYVYIPVEALDLTAVLDCEAVPELRDAELQCQRLSVIGAALREDRGAS